LGTLALGKKARGSRQLRQLPRFPGLPNFLPVFYCTPNPPLSSLIWKISIFLSQLFQKTCIHFAFALTMLPLVALPAMAVGASLPAKPVLPYRFIENGIER
jgi:hypothetical protein